MAGGLHVVLGRLDGALAGVVHRHQEGGADDTLDHLAVVLLLAERAVGLQGLLGRVRQQLDGEVVVRAELRQRLRLVRADAEDLHAGVIELAEILGEIARLGGAARGVGARVEVHDHAGAGEVL